MLVYAQTFGAVLPSRFPSKARVSLQGSVPKRGEQTYPDARDAIAGGAILHQGWSGLLNQVLFLTAC
jgi:hypothetical protein